MSISGQTHENMKTIKSAKEEVLITPHCMLPYNVYKVFSIGYLRKATVVHAV